MNTAPCSTSAQAINRVLCGAQAAEVRHGMATLGAHARGAACPTGLPSYGSSKGSGNRLTV